MKLMLSLAPHLCDGLGMTEEASLFFLINCLPFSVTQMGNSPLCLLWMSCRGQSKNIGYYRYLALPAGESHVT